MALVDIPWTDYPSATRVPVVGLTNVLIDATGEKCAFIFSVPKTGNIDRVGFLTGVVTTPQTLRAGLQTLDASGNPSGSAYGGMVAGTQTSPASTTYYEVTLGTAAAATMGDMVALVVEFDSTAGNLNIRVTSQTQLGYPTTQHFTAAWADNAGHPVCHVRYDDASYPMIGTHPVNLSTSQAYQSGTSPNEYASKIVMPFPARAIGVWAMLAATAAGTCELVAYEGAASTTAARTVSIDNDILQTTIAVVSFPFTSALSLTLSETYRVSIKATAAVNITTRLLDFNTAAIRAAMQGGTNNTSSSRAGAAWTDSTTRIVQAGFILDQLDNGASTGGSRGTRVEIGHEGARTY